MKKFNLKRSLSASFLAGTILISASSCSSGEAKLKEENDALKETITALQENNRNLKNKIQIDNNELTIDSYHPNITSHDLITSGDYWKCTEHYLYIEGNYENYDSNMDEAALYYGARNNEYGLEINFEKSKNVPYESLNYDFIKKLTLNGENLSVPYGTIALSDYPNLKSLSLNGHLLKYLTASTLNSLFTSLSNNNGSLEIYYNLDEEDIASLTNAFDNILMAKLESVKLNIQNENPNEILKVVTSLPAKKILLDANDGLTDKIEGTIYLNNRTEELSIIDNASLGEYFKIITQTPIKLSILTYEPTEDTIFDLPKRSTVEIASYNGLLSAESLTSLKKYDGSFNDMPLSVVGNETEILTYINSLSPYAKVTRSNKIVNLTLDIPQNVLTDNDLNSIQKVIDFARQYSLDEVPNITINGNNKTPIDYYEYLTLPYCVGNLTINLNTTYPDTLNLIDYTYIKNLTINNKYNLDLVENTSLLNILSNNILPTGNVVIDKLEMSSCDIAYYPVSPTNQTGYYTLTVNGKTSTIYEYQPTLTRTK